MYVYRMEENLMDFFEYKCCKLYDFFQLLKFPWIFFKLKTIPISVDLECMANCNLLQYFHCYVLPNTPSLPNHPFPT